MLDGYPPTIDLYEVVDGKRVALGNDRPSFPIVYSSTAEFHHVVYEK